MKKSFKLTLAAMALTASALTAADNFGGLGISFYAGKNGVSVVGVMPNSPAANIGLQSGDIILSANGTELSSVEPSQQVGYLRGTAGSSVSLIVERAGKQLSLSAKRAQLSVQSLEPSYISSWYGKSEGLTSEEISHLANQKTAEGYQFLGVMQQGVPISTSTENLSANNVHQFSMKKAEEKTESKEASSDIRDLNQSGKAQANSYVNAKGAQAKKQNSEKRTAVSAYKVK